MGSQGDIKKMIFKRIADVTYTDVIADARREYPELRCGYQSLRNYRNRLIVTVQLAKNKTVMMQKIRLINELMDLVTCRKDVKTDMRNFKLCRMNFNYLNN